jgi:hypothetical protein
LLVRVLTSVRTVHVICSAPCRNVRSFSLRNLDALLGYSSRETFLVVSSLDTSMIQLLVTYPVIKCFMPR